MVSRSIGHRDGGFMFITANILHVDGARKSINLWPEGIRELAYPLFINVMTAIQGRALLLPEIMCTSVYEVSTWKSSFADVHYRQVPEVIGKMQELGIGSSRIARCAMERFIPTNTRQAGSLLKTILKERRLIIKGFKSAIKMIVTNTCK
jgi:hypothetical protein